ncbi:MAG: integrating conjugative element protein (TIGR03765 family) [Francisellaceae bacterium]|jgi:integrating conjugative element protein (TIGR03765 family)
MNNLWLLLAMSFTFNAFAAPVVIADIGTTTPVLANTTKVKPTPKFTDVKDILRKNIMQQFQVNTPELKVGKVKPTTKPIKDMSFPIALVGCDKYSYIWLKHYQDKLKEQHVTAMVVNCKNKSAFDELKQAADLAYLPVNGKAFVKRFNVHNYPIMITSEGMFQ